MTNEEMLGVAEIVERATNRFNEQAARFRERSAAYDRLIAEMSADHEAKMAEHRASFGARTEADRQIIEGLRADVEDLRNRLNLLGIKAAKQAGEALGITGLFDDTKITVRREPDQNHGSRIVISDANDMGEANIYLTESGARQMATALIGLCDVRKVPQ